MAGIGFELKKLFDEDMYTKRASAYLYSAVVAAGPWLLTVITLNILNILSDNLFIDITQKDLFMGTIIYSFIFSQILVSPLQMMMTRYIADKLYEKKYKLIGGSFIGVLKMALLIGLVLVIIYYYGKNISLSYKVLAGIFFLTITSIWVLMIYLSAIKNYKIILIAFFSGSLFSIISAVGLLNSSIYINFYNEAFKILLAFTMGLIVTGSILFLKILKTFSFTGSHSYDFIKSFSKYSILLFIGLFYTVGLWIDDFIIWFSNLGVDVFNTYRFAPIYDNAIFWAYLTIIPTITLFLVNIETEFYVKYKKYYGLIKKNATLESIKNAEDDMVRVLFKEIFYTIEIQAILTIVFIIISGQVFSFLGYPVLVREIFQITALGALCNAFLLIVILVMLYFEARLFAFFSSALFLIGNSFWTYYFLNKGENYFGFGYFIGALISFLVAFLLLILFIKNITFYTFSSQPIFLKNKNLIWDKLIKLIKKYQLKKIRILKYFDKNFIKIIILIIIVISSILMFKKPEKEYRYKQDKKVKKENSLEGREKISPDNY